jgi:hypothetical protein
MLKDRKLRIAWRAYLAEKTVMQRLDHPSQAEIAERFKGYFKWRFSDAAKALQKEGSELLAEVLIELHWILIGEDEIVGWRPPALAEARARINETL